MTGSGKTEPKVAGSIGPYGACQADMSEYTGAYVDCMSEEDFIEWHRPRLTALLEAGVDYLAFETFPALLEANAILRLLQQEAPHMPAWISFSCKVVISINVEELCFKITFCDRTKNMFVTERRWPALSNRFGRIKRTV